MFPAGEEEGAFLVVAGEAAPIDVSTAAPLILPHLEARGGGRGQLFQGKAQKLSGRDAAIDALKHALSGD